MSKTSNEKKMPELSSLTKEEIQTRIDNLRETRRGIMRTAARYILRNDPVSFRAARRILEEATRIEQKITELEDL
jgi:shikimate kinase